MTTEEFIRLKSERGLLFSAVVAMTPARIIGKNGSIPWHLPEDMKIFRRLTTGHPIVMGRKTWDSLGKPLPNRQNIVMSRDPAWHADGSETITAPEDIFSLSLMDKNVCIIGGSQIYDIFMPYLDFLYVSTLHEMHDGDTIFPEFESLFPNKILKESFADFDLWKYSR